jgi:hypothetical protein
MNFNELYNKIRAIEEGEMPLAPTKDDGAGNGYDNKDVEECGMPMPIAIGGSMSPAHEQDHVSMNVSLNGAGTGGVRDLMDILRNIEQSDEREPRHHEPEEPLMGDMIRSMEQEESVGEEYENSMPGHSGATEFGIDAITQKGDDLLSKSRGALKHNGGENPMHEALVDRLSQMYAAIKEERTEEKDEKGNVVRWKEETPWRKAEKKDGRGKVTNMSDKARRETEKMSKKETEVAEGHSDDDEEKKIRHLMRKYGWSHQEALEYYHYEQHDPKDYEDMEESAKWRDPKYKGQLFTQKKGDSDDYDSIDYGYGMKERPKKDPGQKRRTDAVGDEWENTDKLKSYNGDTGNTTGGAHWNGTGGSTDMKDWKPSPYKDRGVNTQGPRKGLVSKSGIRDVKNRIKGALGHHHTPNLPEQMNESAEVNAMLALNKRLNG